MMNWDQSGDTEEEIREQEERDRKRYERFKKEEEDKLKKYGGTTNE